MADLTSKFDAIWGSPIQTKKTSSRAEEIRKMAKQSNIEKYGESSQFGLSTNITGDYAKNLTEGYKSAVTSPETAGMAGDLGSILNEGQRQDQSTSKNPIIRTGENALAMTSQTLNTIFTPFGALAKSLTDKLSQQIEQNPTIINSPIMGHIADFVQKNVNAITKLSQDHPEAARNIGNALNVLAIGLSGKASEGLTGSKGLDTSLGTLKGIQEGIINKTANLPETIQNVKEGVATKVENIKSIPENVKTGVVNSIKGKPEAQILATAPEDVAKLSLKEQKVWYDNAEKNIKTQTQTKLSNLENQGNIEKTNIESSHGITKTQIENDLQKSIDTTTKNAEDLNKQLKVASNKKVVELRPKIVQTMGEQSKQYRNLIDTAMKGKENVSVNKTQLSSFIDSVADNPETAAQIKAKLQISGIGKGKTTLGDIYDGIKSLKQDVSSAGAKGTRVFSADDVMTDKAVKVLTDYMQSRGVDFSDASKFWAKYAPIRDQWVSDFKPFNQAGTQTGRGASVLITDAKGVDPKNAVFIKHTEDFLGESLTDENKAIIGKMNANEKTALAQKIDAANKNLENDALKAENLKSQQIQQDLEKGKITQEQANKLSELNSKKYEDTRSAWKKIIIKSLITSGITIEGLRKLITGSF